MVKQTRLFGVGFICLIFLAVSVPAFAGTLTLTPPTGGTLGFGAGATRGDIIQMTGDYSLSSIGIEAAISRGASLTFTAYVFDVVGGSGSSPLALGPPTVVTGDGTETWFDLPILFTLKTGQLYDIGIDFGSFSDPNLQVHYYFFDYRTDPPFSVGPVTVLDGEESHSGPGNGYSPNLRLNGTGGSPVPEPTSLVLLGIGALGLFIKIRRK